MSSVCGFFGSFVVGVGGDAVVESHNDIRADFNLDSGGGFRREQVGRSVVMGAEFGPLIGNFAKTGLWPSQRLDLETAGVGKNGVGPVHKFVNTA